MSDARAIATVHIESWRSSYAHILPASLLAGLDFEKRVESWQKHLNDTLHAVFVAEAEGSVVGFCDVGPNRETARPLPGEVYSIYLLEMAKRRGVGTQLWQAGVAWLKARNLTPFIVWVLKDNASARRFYERQGGTLVGEKPVQIADQAYAEVAYAIS
jgi:ribosomal protein S18 acetylase RimI-like enzyme